ncbi:MAG: hypothetical protein KJ069_03120 [Anaerolineae bacterium]|nr:hypothetical protein [Anaerolineae bacterium]
MCGRVTESVEMPTVKAIRLHTAVILPSMLRMALTLLIFAIAYFSPNSSTNSDSRYSLLVSEAMLRQQTIRLDSYREVIGNEQTVEWRLGGKDGRLYYLYPLGSSVLAVPFVLPFLFMGQSMSVPTHDDTAQNLVSALVVVAIFLVLDRIGRYYLPPVASLLVAAACVLGSTLMSALGTALWNQDFTVLCVSVCLWLLVRLENKATFPLLPWLLGLCLFLAYLCRPTTAVFIALVLGFLFFKHRRTFWPVALTAFVLLVCFSLFSRYEFDLWLPLYYLPSQLGGLLNYSGQQATPLPLALYGLLLSPSRGLFIYSPLFLLAILGTIHYRHTVKQHTLLWLICLWSIAHLLVVARFPNWWGGFSFGPRLLTDMLPGLVLLTFFAVQGWIREPPKRGRRLALLLFFTAVAISIIINSYVGMFSRTMLLSHGHSVPPQVDKAPFLLFDWRFPQFATTPTTVCERNRVYLERVLAERRVTLTNYTAGQEIVSVEAAHMGNIPVWEWWRRTGENNTAVPTPTPPIETYIRTFLPLIFKPAGFSSNLNAVFEGWALPGADGVWSVCPTAELIIGPVPTAAPGKQRTLTIQARGHGMQPVTVAINGETVGQVTFSTEFTAEQLTFPSTHLHSDQNNYISFDIPNASPPESSNDLRLLGIFLQKWVIEE